MEGGGSHRGDERALTRRARDGRPTGHTRPTNALQSQDQRPGANRVQAVGPGRTVERMHTTTRPVVMALPELLRYLTPGETPAGY
jgi:hypothetical protein